MQSNYFDTHEPVTMVNFLEIFRQTFHFNVFHEGATMWILPRYIRNPTGIALSARLRVPAERDGSAEGMLTSYLVVFN